MESKLVDPWVSSAMPFGSASSLIPFRPTHDGVFIDIVDRDQTTKDLGNGKVLHLIPDDTFQGPHNAVNYKHPGIRPRWARVLAMGPEVDYGLDVALGDLVLCDTMKWSRKIELARIDLEPFYFWRIGVKDILVRHTGDFEGRGKYLDDFYAKFARMEFTIGRL